MTKNSESKLITGANILRAGIFAVGAWLIAWQFFRENWNGPLAFVLGAVSMLSLIYISRVTAGKPAPFQ